MVDFNSDIPKGQPKLDPTYWENFNKKSEQNSVLSDVNNKIALKDLISIFKANKK